LLPSWMGLSGTFIRSVTLVAWECAALRTLSDPFGQALSDPVDYLHGSRLYGPQDIAYTDEDLRFLDDPSAKTVQESTNNDELALPYMWGRLGDSLNQLMNNILFAERSNKTAVHVFHRGYKHVSGFLDIPKDSQGHRKIWINPKSEASVDTGGNCTSANIGMHAFPMVSCYADARTRRRVMIQYIKPLLLPLARADVHSQDNGSNELVIHVRSGDVWATMTAPKGGTYFEYMMPPCAFYDKIIEIGNKGGAFQHVLVVTEADNNNPCVDLIRMRHPKCTVRVQRSSREEDAAAIMNARHLVTSQSLFSWILAEMNERLETLFTTDFLPKFSEGIMPCGSLGDPKVVKVRVPGLEVARFPPAEKRMWMVDYSKENLSLAEC